MLSGCPVNTSLIATLALVQMSNFASPQNAEKHRPQFEKSAETEKADARSARNVAVPLESLSFDSVPEAPLAEIRRVFARVRDTQMIRDPGHPGLLRRATWLYSNDGCFVRATLGAELFEREPDVFRKLKKVYVFGGRLRAAGVWVSRDWSQNTLSWIYHVALVMKASEDGMTRVLDPALDPTGPLTFDNWRARFVTSPSDAIWSVCSPYTFGPNEDCAADAWPKRSGGVSLKDWKTYFLDDEWNNLESRGLDAGKLLAEDRRTAVISRPGAKWIRLLLTKRSRDAAGSIRQKGQAAEYGDLFHSYGTIERAWSRPILGGEIELSLVSGSVTVSRVEAVY